MPAERLLGCLRPMAGPFPGRPRPHRRLRLHRIQLQRLPHRRTASGRLRVLPRCATTPPCGACLPPSTRGTCRSAWCPNTSSGTPSGAGCSSISRTGTTTRKAGSPRNCCIGARSSTSRGAWRRNSPPHDLLDWTEEEWKLGRKPTNARSGANCATKRPCTPVSGWTSNAGPPTPRSPRPAPFRRTVPTAWGGTSGCAGSRTTWPATDLDLQRLMAQKDVLPFLQTYRPGS